MKSLSKSLALLIGLTMLSPYALADTPPSLKVPDTHSIESKGKVTLFRVQIEGLEFGRDEEGIDAEVFVTLDTKPDIVYTLRIHGDSPPINKIIAETLREAFLTKTPVTIYHQISKQKNVKIHMVQFER